MREILFRGRASDGRWAYGYLFIQAEGTEYEEAYILGGLDHRDSVYDIWKCAEQVDINTVDQFTGLLDKNGTKIFEGDIIRTRRYETYQEELKGYYGYDSEGYPQKVPGYTGSMFVTRQRTNDNYHAVVMRNDQGKYYLKGASVFIDAINNEVVGNIHDNPELLEVKK